jgi:hypothetical protein
MTLCIHSSASVDLTNYGWKKMFEEKNVTNV